MHIDKMRNLNPDELRAQERDAGEQLFRLKFQLKMGQTAGLKKVRELRKDIARVKTVSRERALGIDTNAPAAATSEAAAPAEKKAAAPKKAAAKKAPAKKAANTAAKKSASARKK